MIIRSGYPQGSGDLWNWDVATLSWRPRNSGDYTLRMDEASAVITYIGEAGTGTATSAATWRIKRMDTTSGTIILWADGNTAFDNVWDNRAALSYS